MKAFLGIPAVREGVLAQVRAHALADEIIKGRYWESGKGCAVGCTIHGSDHMLYESLLGIPAEIAYLQDALFEALPNVASKAFPLQFLEAIPVGADLSLVWDKFQHWLLVHPTEGVIATTDDEAVRSHIRTVAVLYERAAQGQQPTVLELKAAEQAAWEAWEARETWEAWEARAARAAWEARAAWAAREARAAWEAWEAREAWAAREARAAWEARAARAAWEARAAWAAREARGVSWRDGLAKATRLQRDKLLELLRDAPISQEDSNG